MILNKAYQEIVSNKKMFDPTSEADMDIARTFFKEASWFKTSPTNTCPFHLEWPYLTIPDMIKDKIVRNVLGIEIKL